MADEDRIALAKHALTLLDLTNLDDECSDEDIDLLCDQAVTPHGSVAAICIWPRFVARAHERLRGTKVKVATVANFPSGKASIDDAVAEARRSAFDGAHEVDLVLPYKAFLAGDHDAAIAMVERVRHEIPETTALKVIIESGELKVPENIRIASVRCIQAGADFIKTSTGKVPINATQEAARIMMEAIHDLEMPVGFKAAGGIRTTDDAMRYLAIADDILGKGWATPETFRFGASSLLADLLATIDGREAAKGDGY